MADHLICPTRAEIKRNIGKFYVYILSKPGGEPFYVGCGMSSPAKKARPRIFDHEKAARRGVQSMKCNIIRKIWSSGGDVRRSIDSWHETKEQMFAREMHLIAAIGRRDIGKGPLANGNDGGTGQINPSPETIEKMRSSHKKRWTKEEREKQRNRVLRQHDADPALRARIGLSQADRWTKEEREKQAERAKLGIRRPDVIEKTAERQRERFKDPAVRSEHAKRAKQRWEDPARRALLSAAQKKNWEDPDYRARNLANRKKGFEARKMLTSTCTKDPAISQEVKDMLAPYTTITVA